MIPNRKRAFTFIELLMVIAIIGILAAILIPAIGAVIKQANIAASKAQLNGYVNAIQLFKGEYNYYPFADAQVDGGKNINELTDDFAETLTARDQDGNPITTGGNRRRISFLDISQKEYFYFNDTYNYDILVDRFNNSNLFIVIDGDGDGIVLAPDPDSPGSNIQVRQAVTAFTVEDEDVGGPDYYIYE